MMTVDTRGFTYVTKKGVDLVLRKYWFSNFSKYYVVDFSGAYVIHTNEYEFSDFGSNTVQVDLNIALKLIRKKAINEFFGDDIF